MGFFFRKSIGIGPFRINLSKSGIGVSAGVKGARVGIGSRGPYVAGGKDGLYYRQNLGTGHRNQAENGAGSNVGPVVVLLLAIVALFGLAAVLFFAWLLLRT